MVNIRKLIFTLPWLSSNIEDSYEANQSPLRINSKIWQTESVQPKSIAIIGAGSAGLSSLKTFVDVAKAEGQSWNIVVFEQRKDVGGVWLPDDRKYHEPDIPETPMHPLLRTNSPHPGMTYPGVPYPSMTNLFPHHTAVWQYHSDFVSRFNISSHIFVNHTVMNVSWLGDSTNGRWNITYTNKDGKVEYKYFDHLIDATGHYHYPHIPVLPGKDVWLDNSIPGQPKREILHSMYFRDPEDYANKTILVVGLGASSLDIILHTTPVSRKVYLSAKEDYEFPIPLPFPSIEVRPVISHLTASSIFFEDGSSCSDVDSVILGTGYELRFPHLKQGNIMHTIPSANSNATYPLGLVTNLRYVFPLHQHLMSLAPHYPPTALFFIGLPIGVAQMPSTKAQSLYAAYTILDPGILPSHEEMLHGLYLQEENIRTHGIDPYYVGHHIFNATLVKKYDLSAGEAYQNALIEYLKVHGALPNDGKKYVEDWRNRTSSNLFTLWGNWNKIEKMGKEKEWLEGVSTEKEWADLMDRLAAWKG